MGVRGELFSNKVILPNRTYFFNVKENRIGDLYLNIVESKNRESGGFDRQSVILFADDLQEFLKGFDESLRVMEKAMRDKRQPKPLNREDRNREDRNRNGSERKDRSREDRNRNGPERKDRGFKGDRSPRGERNHRGDRNRQNHYGDKNPGKRSNERGPNRGQGKRIIVKKRQD